ncbi:MAG: fructosamine kinase family protein [Terrimonas ferruginea]|uniref:fructosamine kinase family protein n=1 Tax=Terrimonas ferruginea TaxID=249 RepID=UPI001AC90795|nr:fructosamine kinase family protein [Terrimonas ferruginea]MBN8781928.1 fructosamine kinase family protein [Terrimonas ferruginea]
MDKNPIFNTMHSPIPVILSQVFPQEELVIRSVNRISGGDINDAFMVLTNNGPFLIKTNHTSAPRFFDGELRSLNLLATTNTLTVPKPFGSGKVNGIQFIVMEWLNTGHPDKHFWEDFGTGLASLHAHSNELFGAAGDQYIGTLPQSNAQATTWHHFYRDQRIMPLLRDALNQGLCTREDVTCGERLCNHLAELLPVEPAALLHGDLWSGNFLIKSDGHPALIDPAVYYGHREMDIAMTALFGGFDPVFYQAYNAAYPLQPGWQQRLAVSQLYPLLVHLLLFGSSYYGRVKTILQEYGN